MNRLDQASVNFLNHQSKNWKPWDWWLNKLGIPKIYGNLVSIIATKLQSTSFIIIIDTCGIPKSLANDQISSWLDWKKRDTR